MRDLLALDDPAERVFVVVAIREGYEVGDHGMQSMHRTGTLVQLTEAERYDDGRFDIEVTGRSRAVLESVDGSGEYLRAEVVELGDAAPLDDAEALTEADRTLETFLQYRDQLSALRGGPVLTGAMPTDPTYLSYSLAATCLLSLSERQELLEAPD